MNSYKCSNGDRVPKHYIDYKIREAKERKLYLQLEEYGYIFCEQCKRNDDVPIDCSHVISVDECQKTGRSELAWDLNNIRILGRKCHAEYDNNNIKSPKL